jgi:hypothetical protein
MKRFKVEKIGARRSCDEPFCGPDDWCVVAENAEWDDRAPLVTMGFIDKEMAESFARALERDANRQ